MKFGGTILLLLIIVLVAITLLCHIIALVTNFWIMSSNSSQTNFLNLGLWSACFDNFKHQHENPSRRYTGCYDLYSDQYATIRDWLVPCKICKSNGAIIAPCSIYKIYKNNILENHTVSPACALHESGTPQLQIEYTYVYNVATQSNVYSPSILKSAQGSVSTALCTDGTASL